MTDKAAVEDVSLIEVGKLPLSGQLRLLSIRNQKKIRESSFSPRIITEAEHLRWIKSLEDDAASCFFAFLVAGQIIGGIGLKNIDPVNRIAEWSFYLSSDCHGNGLGRLMAEKALALFFNAYDLSCIVGETLESNQGSQVFHQKLGFVCVRRERRPEATSSSRHSMCDVAVYQLERATFTARA